jgi:hypothetical protein
MANRDAPTSTQGSPARHLTFAELGIGSAIFWPIPGARAAFSSAVEPFALPSVRCPRVRKIPVWA